MFDFRSLYDHGPPLSCLCHEEKLALASNLLQMPVSELFFREELQVVSCQYAPGRYGYVRFPEHGGWELFLPRSNPRRVHW